MSTSVACTTVQSIDIDNCQEEMVQSNNFISFALKNLRKNLFNTSVNERRKITLDEVSNHDTFNDCWIVLYDRVYDVTKFLNEVSWNFFCFKKMIKKDDITENYFTCF